MGVTVSLFLLTGGELVEPSFSGALVPVFLLHELVGELRVTLDALAEPVVDRRVLRLPPGISLRLRIGVGVWVEAGITAVVLTIVFHAGVVPDRPRPQSP